MDYKIEQKDSGGSGMFFYEEDGEILGYVRYSLRDKDVLSLDHTEVDPKMNGKGLAGNLVKTTVEYARKNNLKVDPKCSYAAKQFERHEEYRDLLANKR